MKTAVICDWLPGMRGGERCLEAGPEAVGLKSGLIGADITLIFYELTCYTEGTSEN